MRMVVSWLRASEATSPTPGIHGLSLTLTGAPRPQQVRVSGPLARPGSAHRARVGREHRVECRQGDDNVGTTATYQVDVSSNTGTPGHDRDPPAEPRELVEDDASDTQLRLDRRIGVTERAQTRSRLEVAHRVELMPQLLAHGLGAEARTGLALCAGDAVGAPYVAGAVRVDAENAYKPTLRWALMCDSGSGAWP
jgi:hypothetical protein